jgi:hypothetical protein
VTKIYTAGEHARIIKSDPLYNDELGEKQVGLVGTVVTGHTTGGAYIKFPHYDGHLYYFASEIEPVGTTPAPEPEKEYLFREGDTVHYTDTNTAWKGAEFTVNEDIEASFRGVSAFTVTQVTEGMKHYSYRVGSVVHISPSSVTKGAAPKPEPKFKQGDWVKVVGRNDQYDGIVGTIEKKEWANFWGVTGTDGRFYHFVENKLVPTEKPFEPTYKVGDWVKVVNYSGWNGTVGQVVKERTATDTITKIKVHGSERTGVFLDSEIEASEKPAEPHWTVSKPVGALAQVELGGQPERVLLKVSDTEWLHLYQHDNNGKVGCGTKRDNGATELLTHNSTINWKSNVA